MDRRTCERISRNNNIRSWISNALNTTALLCYSGPIFQTFLSSIGFSSDYVFIHSTLIQAVSLIVTCVGARWGDHGNPIKRNAVAAIPVGLLYLCYIPMCIMKEATLSTYLFLLAISILQTIAVGLQTVCGYKLPYIVWKREDYGLISAVSGAIAYLVSAGSGIIISNLSKNYSYDKIMLYGCLISTLLTIISAILLSFQKPLVDESQWLPQKEVKDVPLSSILSEPIFLKLILANILRGFGSGFTGVIAVLILELGFDNSISGTLVSVQSVSSLLGCVLFAVAYKRMSCWNIVFIGSGIFAITPLLLIVKNEWVFLFCIGTILLGRIFCDYAIPNSLRSVVPIGIAAPYNAWRLVLTTAGSIISTAVAPVLPVKWLLIISAIAYIYSGSNYYCVLRKTASTVKNEKIKDCKMCV